MNIFPWNYYCWDTVLRCVAVTVVPASIVKRRRRRIDSGHVGCTVHAFMDVSDQLLAATQHCWGASRAITWRPIITVIGCALTSMMSTPFVTNKNTNSRKTTAKFSTTRSIAQRLCDSWASCYRVSSYRNCLVIVSSPPVLGFKSSRSRPLNKLCPTLFWLRAVDFHSKINIMSWRVWSTSSVSELACSQRVYRPAESRLYRVLQKTAQKICNRE